MAAVGGYVGLGVGLLAGFGWCWIMINQYQRAAPTGRRLYGGWCGVGLGAAATIVLHIALMAASGRWDPGMLATGLVFGLVGGGILGALCTQLFPRQLKMMHPAGQKRTGGQ